MQPLCVIPARRGSKRLPQKNILPLCGEPMLNYSVRAAIESGIFDYVYIYTEDDEIGEIAVRAGAIFHRRPIKLAGDLLSATDVCLEIAHSLRDKGTNYDVIVCLQPSSPLRSAEDIKGSWQSFINAKASYLVSVTPIDPHYFHWALAEKPDGWEMYFGNKFMLERPLLPPVYRPNGSIKIAKLGELAVTKNFFGKPLATYITPDERSIHVAERFDFDVAEYLAQKILSKTE